MTRPKMCGFCNYLNPPKEVLIHWVGSSYGVCPECHAVVKRGSWLLAPYFWGIDNTSCNALIEETLKTHAKIKRQTTRSRTKGQTRRYSTANIHDTTVDHENQKPT